MENNLNITYNFFFPGAISTIEIITMRFPFVFLFFYSVFAATIHIPTIGRDISFVKNNQIGPTAQINAVRFIAIKIFNKPKFNLYFYEGFLFPR